MYRISSYSFRPWILSSLEYFPHLYVLWPLALCTVTFGIQSSKKNSFRGNYMRKYGIHNKERGIHNWNSWCTASVTVTMISVFGSNKFLKKFFRHLHKQDFWDYREVLKVLCFLRRSQNFKEIFLLVLTFLSNLWPSHNILTLACQPISF